MLRSIITTVAVSALIAYGLTQWVDFWKSFSLVTGIQFVAFWIINTRFQVDKDKLYAEFDENFEGILNMSRAAVNCPCNQHVFEEEVFVNGDNIHRCPKCRNNIKLDCPIRAVLLTDPGEVTDTL
jgi:hypothetical protein